MGFHSGRCGGLIAMYADNNDTENDDDNVDTTVGNGKHCVAKLDGCYRT